MLQRVQRLINIKIAKAYRTISFEASCMMAGVPPIGTVIEEKARVYKIKHNTERCEYELDIPLLVKEWPHPARRLNIMETRDWTPYSAEIYTDGSKIGGKFGAGAAIYVGQVLKRQCKYKLQNCCSNNQAQQIAILKSLEELTSLSDHNERTAAIYTDSRVTLASVRNNSIHNPLNCRNTKQGSKTHYAEVVDPLRMGEGTYWNRRKLVGRQTRQRSTRGWRWTKDSIQEDTNNISCRWTKEGRAHKVAEIMGKHRQRSAMQIVLPASRTETKTENTNDILVQSYCLWPWENKIGSAQVQINR